jgi:hypothetical protein
VYASLLDICVTHIVWHFVTLDNGMWHLILLCHIVCRNMTLFDMWHSPSVWHCVIGDIKFQSVIWSYKRLNISAKDSVCLFLGYMRRCKTHIVRHFVTLDDGVWHCVLSRDIVFVVWHCLICGIVLHVTLCDLWHCVMLCDIVLWCDIVLCCDIVCVVWHSVWRVTVRYVA